jgi:hypothetical protein
MPKSTFRDHVTWGTVIATAQIEEEQFGKIIRKINKRFELRIEASREAYELFRDRIPLVPVGSGRKSMHWTASPFSNG